MRRRAAVFGPVLAAIVVHRTGLAQTPPGPARIGWLSSQLYQGTPLWPPFIAAMQELGWVEGRHYVVDALASEGHAERLPSLARELLQRRVDVIVAGGTPPAVAAKAATATVPIVFISVGDPVRSGLVVGFAQPGGNATGTGGLAPGIYVKQLEILTGAIASARRIAVFVNSGFGMHASFRTELEPAAQRIGVTLHPLELQAPEQLNEAFKSARLERADALLMLGQPFMFREAERLARLAIEAGLPTMSPFVELTKAGVLMSYGSRLVDDMKRIPYFLDRILKGAKPGELPVEQPSRFYLTINQTTARVLKLALSRPLLLRADEVIE